MQVWNQVKVVFNQANWYNVHHSSKEITLHYHIEIKAKQTMTASLEKLKHYNLVLNLRSDRGQKTAVVNFFDLLASLFY